MKQKRPPEEQHLGNVLHLAGIFAGDKPLMDRVFLSGEADSSVRRLYALIAGLEDMTRAGVFVGVTASRLKIWASDRIVGARAPWRRIGGDFGTEKIEQEMVLLLKDFSGDSTKIVPQGAGGVLKRSTLNEHLVRAGCTRAAVIQAAKRRPALRRWEAPHRNAVWQGDAKSGYWLPNPAQPGRRRQVHLLAWIDDYSRLVYGQFYWEEQLPRLEDCLKRSILRYGLPQRIYVDNGAIYSSRHLQRICARLRIRLTHSRPYRPMGRGKIERFFRHVDQSFGPEVQVLIEQGKITTLAQLNEFFWAWLDVGYNRRRHGATGQAPLDRWNQDATEIRRIDAIALREAFLWGEQRVVDKTGCFPLHGNSYEVDSALAGRKVTLRYDPFDLSQIQLWWVGQRYPDPTPLELRRKRRREVERLTTPPAPASGLNYLALVKQQHEEQVRQELGQTHFSRLMSGEGKANA